MNTETPTDMLREIKSSTEWSEPRIASELGISQPTVNRILNGQPDCSSKTYRAICELRARLRSEGKSIKDRRAGAEPSVSGSG